MKDNMSKIVIVILSVLVIVSLACAGALYLKNEHLEEKYDDLEDRYESNFDNSQNTNNPGENKNYISKTEALSIALKDLNLNSTDIYDQDIELEYKLKYKMTVYEITFDYDFFEYEYYINPITGEILDSFKSID